MHQKEDTRNPMDKLKINDKQYFATLDDMRILLKMMLNKCIEFSEHNLFGSMSTNTGSWNVNVHEQTNKQINVNPSY